MAQWYAVGEPDCPAATRRLLVQPDLPRETTVKHLRDGEPVTALPDESASP